MMTNVWVAEILTLLVGAALGGWLALRAARLRFASKLRLAANELQQKHASATDQLRSAQVRAQTELEQTRNSFKRQLALAAEEPRAAAARAEERLRAAYDELDRLRRGDAPTDTGSTEMTDGFAATRPMREGL